MWGAGREVRWGHSWWGSVADFDGRFSRREFLCFVVVWLGAGSLLLVWLEGGLEWLSFGGSPASQVSEASVAGLPVSLVMWCAVASACARRWWDVGSGLWSFLGLGVVVAFMPGVLLVLLLVYLVLMPPDEFGDRWAFMRERRRVVSGDAVVVPARSVGVASFAGASSSADLRPQPRPAPEPESGVQPAVVSAEKVESEEELLEFLRGGWGDEE